MGITYLLRVGDKTTCGGIILTGCTNRILDGQPMVRRGDSYIYSKDKKLYHIVGGQPGHFIHSIQAAGTAHSVGTCPCRRRPIDSISNATYFYESGVLSAPKLITNRVVSIAPRSAPKPLTMAPEPYCPGEEDKPPRGPVDGGFCILPYGSKPPAYEPCIFINPPGGTRELYHELNPDIKRQPGSTPIVVDPEKQNQQQIEALQEACGRVDKVPAPLTLQDAKLLHGNREAVDAFSYQLFGNYLGNAGDGFRHTSEIGKSYYGEVEQILTKIQELYKDTYSHNKGIISEGGLFGQQARLFKNLGVVLNKFSKTQLDLEEYGSTKEALGSPTNSIVYKWDKTGIDNIEGHTTYIERSAKLMNLMETVGFVGIGLDFSGYALNVYDACSRGRESAYRKAAVTEYSKFGLKQGNSILAEAVVGRVATVPCTQVLGISTIEIDGAGTVLCFVTGVGVTTTSGKIAEEYDEDVGEKLGDYVGNYIIYENFFHSK